MRAISWLTVSVVLLGAACESAHAQLLKQLEQRLGQAAEALAPPSADNPPASEAEPGYLGLVADNEPDGGGVLVVDVYEGSPAAAAGLKKGDLITQANGRKVASLDALAEVLRPLTAGSRIAFTVANNGEEQKVDVTLGRQPAEQPADEPPPEERAGPPADRPPLQPPRFEERNAPEEDRAAGRPTLGITVAPITEEASARYGLTTRRGAFISGVRPGSPAEQAGLPIGGAIVAMDGVRIDTADQLVDAIRTSRAGQEVEISYYSGPRLTRKTVRLGSAGPAAPMEGAGPNVRVDVGPGDRPLMRAAERVLGNLGRPPADAPAAGVPPDVNALLQEVDELRAQVQRLEERLEALEGRAPASNPPRGDAPAEEAPPPEDTRPRLPLLPPTTP